MKKNLEEKFQEDQKDTFYKLKMEVAAAVVAKNQEKEILVQDHLNLLEEIEENKYNFSK